MKRRFCSTLFVFTLLCSTAVRSANCQEETGVDLAVIRAAFDEAEKALSRLTLVYSFLTAEGATVTYVLALHDGVYYVGQRDCDVNAPRSSAFHVPEGAARFLKEPGPKYQHIWENGIAKTYSAKGNSGRVFPEQLPSEREIWLPALYSRFQSFTYGTFLHLPIRQILESDSDVKSRLVDIDGRSAVELSVAKGPSSEWRIVLDPERNWLLLEWSDVNEGEELYRLKAKDHAPLENGFLFPMRWEVIRYDARINARLDQNSLPSSFPDDFVERAKEAALTHPGSLTVSVVHLASSEAPDDLPVSFMFPKGSFIQDELSGESVIVGAFERKYTSPGDSSPLPDLLPLLFPGVSWSDFEAERDAKVVREIHPY